MYVITTIYINIRSFNLVVININENFCCCFQLSYIKYTIKQALVGNIQYKKKKNEIFKFNFKLNCVYQLLYFNDTLLL